MVCEIGSDMTGLLVVDDFFEYSDYHDWQGNWFNSIYTSKQRMRMETYYGTLAVL